MKREFIKTGLIAAAALLALPAAVLAQKEKDKDEVVVQGNKKAPKDKEKHQTIVITRTGDNEGKTVIEIDGDKIKVNGKDAKESKDVNVNVTTMDWSKGRNIYRMSNRPGGGGFTMNMDEGSLFMEDTNRAMLGVNTEGHEKGAEIISVTKESAAEKLGLKKGDIITRIDNKKIESSDDLTEAVRAHKPGEKVSVTYLREGKELKGSAELTKWKGLRMSTFPRVNGMEGLRDLENFHVDIPPTPPTVYGPAMVYGSGRRLGLSIQDTDDGVGVKVLEVDEDGAAAKAGLKKDDIIIGVDGKDVKGTDDVTRTIRSNREKSNFSFRIKRAGKEQDLEVKFPKKLKTADL